LKLSVLIKGLALKEGNKGLEMDPDIVSIHYRSQTVLPGGLFVAMPGQSVDGHDFIQDAVNRGAAAVVVERPIGSEGVVVRVKNSRNALSAISSRFFQEPSLRLCLIGITGTNGKTTTSYLIENILKKSGYDVGVIGTVNYRYGGRVFENPMTTPESLDLQRILREMEVHGVTHVVMEVSSHAIDLDRAAHCYFDVGVFTNLSQDHLDYHKDMASYWVCKKRFFNKMLVSGPKKDMSIAVINSDNEKGSELYRTHGKGRISVAAKKTADISLKGFKSSLAGISGTLVVGKKEIGFNSPLVGGYNVENILCAAGVGVALNLPLDAVSSGIGETGYVPGRLEAIENEAGKYIFVDYAHTPDALEHALTALSEMKPSTSKLICVFGCGGNRDKAKRSLMGEIAGRICDRVVITTDNPRNEAPGDIIRQIEEGVKRSLPICFSGEEKKKKFNGKCYGVEADRKKAIALGIGLAEFGDIVLIAGKGHETYQIIGNQTFHFDDREAARNVLEEQSGS
jgi:UDP-N-acetylmuramoyl-L-alanyl-D-glutamate--2,6-diaminopimelate ligase